MIVILIILFCSCTKVVNTGASPSNKAYVINLDLTAGGLPSNYSFIIVSSDLKSFLFNTPDTAYHAITSGATNFYIESYSNGTTINSNNITLSGNTYYSSLIYNQATGVPGIGVIKDDLTAPQSGYIKLRILYSVDNTVANTPAKISIVNQQTQDSIVNYNRTDLDFFRIQPLTNFTAIKAGLFSIYVDNTIIYYNLSLNNPKSIFTILVNKKASINSAYYYATNYFINK